MRTRPAGTATLRLAPRFSHVVECDGGVVLVEDDGSAVLEGATIGALVRRLDGLSTASGIAFDMASTHDPAEVQAALAWLQDRGIVVPTGSGGSPVGTGLRETIQRKEVRELAASLSSGLHDASDESFTIGEVDWAPSGLCELVVTDDYLRPSLARLEREMFVAGRPYVLARLAWESVWLGPHVVPGKSACGACLRDRLRLNVRARTMVYPDHDTAGREATVRRLRPSAHFTSAESLAELIFEVIEYARGLGGLTDTLVVRHANTSTADRHTIQRLPHCPQCGTGSRRPPGVDFELRARAKVAGSGGGFRVTSPEDTLDRLSHHVSPLTGVVRAVDRVDVPDTDLIHVYTANHTVHAGTATLRRVTSDHRDHSGGKGSTDTDAKVSALCEAIERFSALHRGDEPRVLARLDELGSDAIAPNDLLNFSPDQFERRHELNDPDDRGFQWIPEPYPPTEVLSWTEVRSLVTGDVRLVPTAAVYLGFEGPGSRYCKGDSNGLAGGNCLEEAILQGLLELVERDAVAIWWYNRLRLPGVDLGSFGDPYIDSIMRYYGKLDRHMWVLDLTLDLGVPCFAALSSRHDGSEIIFGFGAHLDASIAIRRAVTELNQMLPTVMKSPRERARQLLPEFAPVLDWWASETLGRHPYLVPSSEPGSVGALASRRNVGADLLADVERAVALVAAAGVDLLVCDLTREEVGFPVARVFAPGLRHFWRRLGPGRLFDVPVDLGLIDQPSEEWDFNPIGMFV